MGGFFEALSSFLESDLAKSYGWVILVSFIICVFIICFIIWVIMDKLVVPAKLIEANNAKRDYERLKEENDALKKENKELNEKIRHYRLLESFENDPEEDFTDNALNAFIHKK